MHTELAGWVLLDSDGAELRELPSLEQPQQQLVGVKRAVTPRARSSVAAAARAEALFRQGVGDPVQAPCLDALMP